ncbi:hypothetical protein ACIPJ2_18075 [Curtobacterium sp. NPDC090217]|uniref:hypothetical protein n=1 Tax=Curtobacterium sp. NPDC090217 TaxID=3363970 RepID=UPI003830330E
MHPRLPERIAMCVVAALFCVLNLGQKLLCTVPRPADVSRSAYVNQYGCWSDVVSLWNQRELGAHVFPYVFGTWRGDPPRLGGGTVEYPTLTGIWVWITALPADSAKQFLVVTAAVAVVIAVLVTLMLARIAGRRAWVFAATPPLALYSAYNWDLLPVLCTVAGLLVATSAPRTWPPLLRWALAGAAFGFGGAFKLYPLMFLAALVLAALLDRDLDLSGRFRRALTALGSGVGVVLAANVPFMVVNFEGWYSVFQFQAQRPIGASTLSVWYYGLLPRSADLSSPIQDTMSMLATVSTALGILAVLVVTVVVGARTGRTPWIQASAAMLCVYMVCNKVDSPQYVLWLLPFFVVLRLGGWWIAAYLVTDVCLTVGFFRSGYYQALGVTGDTWASQMMTAAMWMRAALLVVLVVVFLRTPTVRRTVETVIDPGTTIGTTTEAMAEAEAEVSVESPAPARSVAADPTA